MKQKVLAGIVLTIAFIGSVALRQFNAFIVDMLTLFMLTLAGIEMAKALEHKYAKPILPVVAFYPLVSFGVFYLGAYFEKSLGYTFFNGLTMTLFLVASLFLVLSLVMALSNGKVTKERVFTTMFTVIYPCTLGIFILALNRVGTSDLLYGTSEMGSTPLALFLTVGCFSDMFAYFVGSWFKGPKLAPKISPNKTISGAIGGLVGGFVGAIAILLISRTGFLQVNELPFVASTTGALFLHSALIGIIGSVFTQAGDLVASAVKRDVGIKDYGKLLGSHGGMMDRFDGMFFIAFFLYVYIVIATVI